MGNLLHDDITRSSLPWPVTDMSLVCPLLCKVFLMSVLKISAVWVARYVSYIVRSYPRGV